MKNKAIQILSEKQMAAQQARYPNTPLSFIPKPSYSDKTEKGLCACILAWLLFNGHHADQTGKPGRIFDNRKEVQDVLGRSRVIGSVTWVKCNNPVLISATIHGQAVKIKIAISTDPHPPTIQSGIIEFTATDFQHFYTWYLTMVPAEPIQKK